MEFVGLTEQAQIPNLHCSGPFWPLLPHSAPWTLETASPQRHDFLCTPHLLSCPPARHLACRLSISPSRQTGHSWSPDSVYWLYNQPRWVVFFFFLICKMRSLWAWPSGSWRIKCDNTCKVPELMFDWGAYPQHTVNNSVPFWARWGSQQRVTEVRTLPAGRSHPRWGQVCQANMYSPEAEDDQCGRRQPLQQGQSGKNVSYELNLNDGGEGNCMKTWGDCSRHRNIKSKVCEVGSGWKK